MADRPADSQTTVITNADEHYVRTALVVDSMEKGGSIDILDRNRKLVARINLFVNSNENFFAVDVIDIDRRFDLHTGLVFNDGKREAISAVGGLVAVDFRDKKEST